MIARERNQLLTPFRALRALVGDPLAISEATRARLTLALVAGLTVPAMIFFTVDTFQRGDEWSALGWAYAAGTLLLGVTFLGWSSPAMPLLARLSVAYCAALMVMSFIFTPESFTFAWILFVPTACIVLFGRREGLCWSAGLLVLWLLILANPSWFAGLPVADVWPHPDRAIGLIIVILMISAVTYGYESLRIRARESLEARNAKLEALTERQAETQARLNRFASIATDFLFETDADLRIIYASSERANAAKVDLGFFCGQDVAAVLRMFVVEGAAPLLAAMSRRDTIRDLPIEGRSLQGARILITVRADPMFRTDNSFAGYVGVLTDITHLDHMRQVVGERDLALVQTGRLEAVARLTGGVAHDFNNLLTVIVGNLEVMRDELGGGAPREELEDVLDAARRAGELTGKLLSFGRQQTLFPRRIDLREQLPPLVQRLEMALGASVPIGLFLEDALWDVELDPVQFESVLLALLANAEEAMRNTQGNVGLSVRNRTLSADEAAELELETTDFVSIRVSDAGPGFSADALARAFEPFYSTRSRGPGGGLGLSIVEGFARQSQGAARLRNAPEGGAEVELLFPRAPEPRAPVPELADEVPERSETPPLRVLVVEDEPAVRTLVIGLLRHLGHEATSVTSAAEARESFRPGAFDLLLTDVVLAAGDGGARLAEELREQDPALAVLLMSGYADGMVGDSEFALASFPLLVKPFGTRALEAAIAALVFRQGSA